MVFDSSGSPDTARPPISLHPAFPAVVALWFAALLGLGSMVLPVVLVERMVEMSGISALVPAAAPPLGFMARGLIALASGVAGAVVGIAVARRVARAHDSERPSRVAKLAKGARRPISVNEELGGERVVNGFGLPVNRRRALAIAEDERPSDFLYMAPLPGNDDDQALPFAEQPQAPRADDEPLELSDAFEDRAEAAGPQAHDREAIDPAEDPSMNPPHDFRPPSSSSGAEPREELEPASSAGNAEPLPFAAPSLARRAIGEEPPVTGHAAPAAVPQAYEPEPFETEPFEPEPQPEDSAEQQPFRGDWSSAPLGELGLVQLVQRLGASLERRREWLASAAVAPAPALAPPAGFEPAPAEEAAQAMAAYFGKPAGGTTTPADADDAANDAADFELKSSAPVNFEPRPRLPGSWPAADDDDDADVMPSFTLPLRRTVSPTIAFEAPTEQETPPAEPESDDADEHYSSLLAMRNPFAPKANGFVRIEEPETDDEAIAPTVVFPGHGTAEQGSAMGATPRAFDPPAGSEQAHRMAPQPAADSDDALRAALATLQRMSGTA